MKMLKKCWNGKLYSRDAHAYVSLSQVVMWVRQGDEVEVRHGMTGEDLTSATLARAIYEGVRRAEGWVFADSARLLARVIEEGIPTDNSEEKHS